MNAKLSVTTPTKYAGLELLSSAAVILDRSQHIVYLNPAAENLLRISQRAALGRELFQVIGVTPELVSAIMKSLSNKWGYSGQNIQIERGEDVLHVDCTVTPVDEDEGGLVIEMRPVDQQLRARREERLIELQLRHRELMRNLAHEIKNPLGGIRGAAQLLEHELPNPSLREYTQVIIKEADRLQDLMQRLLQPHQGMQPAPTNIHEILERVRSLILAEFPKTLMVRRDYDTSLPDLTADREQMIQAVLNIARNAAQAMSGNGQITLRTRAVRQVTLLKHRWKLAIEVQVIDNGPGIPRAILERMFYPLVSGREGGTGLGLTIAQSFIQQHQGTIECESRPGHTQFIIRLPVV
ncbi:nitrogen regulation protein NR(II) [Fluviibacter phosphoraccumulans]|jgi:two-component system nitrogen regulation sensor histidine kinase GlnL|uniref:Sensory histidine kinase/phosphatase NtrB n=1 Tax=Fluviibacter phosphoraccumulans TaxID=1751046 RepID=A0A679HUB0_9RHOO|nr:nitrogen regulation protein NR(II) [Fluviibacter phosphoraccumulans]BBU68554.1 signal transduction histidine kinase [Fluviibacter phosphoraccumulans]BBU72291.1 signal transduction histidine kinase [Fluviibacter phosphoraccumulans]BCA64467.1 signal transduction histidine kinase [Fluviibacter phosphoraccumulans]